MRVGLKHLWIVSTLILAIAIMPGIAWSQTSPSKSSVSIAATQATLTIALWEGKSYLIRTAPGQPPSFDPVSIAYIQLGTDVPPTPPPPSTLTVRGKAIRDAALKATADPVRNETAQKLALLYEQIGIKIKAKEISGAAQITAISKAGADILLVGNADAWKPFREVLTEQATALTQEGGDDAGFVKLLDEVRAGLLSTVPQDAIDLAKWTKIIMEIVAMIMKLFPSESFQ